MAPKLQRVAPPRPSDDVPTPDGLFGLDEHSLKVADLDLDAISPNPHQPRRSFDQDSLQALADSIACHGLQQPIVVRRDGGGRYVLIAGERRLRAHRLLGRTRISAVISTVGSDGRAAQLALVENVQRQNLNAVELASGLKSLIESQGLTHEDAGKIAGVARPTVSRLLTVLRLPDDILTDYQQQGLAETIPQSMLTELAEIEDEAELRLLWEQAKSGTLRREEVRVATRRQKPQNSQDSRGLLAVGRTLKTMRKSVQTLRTITLETVHRDELRALRDEIDKLIG